VGESGSGKSQMLLGALGLSAENARVSGSVRLDGEEILGAPERRLNQIRGRRVGYVFQDPMTSLNPHLTIGAQLMEPLFVHRREKKAAAAARAIELLKAVHISAPEERLRQYPHQLSGGMRQRVAIAMALICGPGLLIADEPTTALDVTVQAQVLTLLREIRERFGTAIILVTHDLGVIAEVADRVNVMYAGRFVETGTVDDIFYRRRHPYTRALEQSIHGIAGGSEQPAELAAAAAAAGGATRTVRAPRLEAIAGNPPDPSAIPPGCAFHPRCRYRMPICDQQIPVLTLVDGIHQKACFFEGELDRPEAAR
jgi:oligopeptide/dipeptide ABC transporter ATP-binding protein